MDITRETSIWSEDYPVATCDADYHGGMFIHQLCRLFQEAAHRHADHLGVGYQFLTANQMAWVLLSLRIEVKRYPRWDETITVQTWPSNRDRLYYYRDFRILDGAAESIVRAVTKWLVTDVERRIPQKTENIVEFRFNLQPTQFPEWVDKIVPWGLLEPFSGFRVDYTDLDLNLHLNNTRYIERVMAAYPREFLDHMTLRELDVNFLAEAQYGDEVVIEKVDPVEGQHLLTLTKQADGKEVCRMRLRWERMASGQV